MTRIKSYKASASLKYDPDAYIESCKENNMIPTQEGFLDFIQEWVNDDFGCLMTNIEIVNEELK